MSKRRELVDGKLLCNPCQTWKVPEDFYADKSGSYGKSANCKECTKVRARENHKKARSPGSPTYDTFRQRQKSRIYRGKYGLTLEEVHARLESQGGVCAVCEDPLEERAHGYHVDHCHVNGHVRGILCARCNLGLGYFLDDTERLEKAIEYLKRDKEQQNDR